jgi:hypothetical protein
VAAGDRIRENFMNNEREKPPRTSGLPARLSILVAVFLALILGERAVLWAAAQLKSWQNGDLLTAADLNANFAALNTALRPDAQPGGSPATAGASCAALKTLGVTLSGAYYVKNPASADAAMVNATVLVYCDQSSEGGGWVLVQNSVIGTNTSDFWNIPYAARFARRGRPSLDSNFYDGSLYQTAATTYLDVVEDLQGKAATEFIATTDGINNTTMRFTNPTLMSGFQAGYDAQFAAGWSALDYDGDTYPPGNCAATYAVTQHYSGCWVSNLGSDADAPLLDAGAGPHAHTSLLAALMLAGDGSTYSRVRRISRFVRW